ncbi:BrnT family toxin [Nguyenibacter vanlangensis]|uniref:BrnT family toxin n=1 Tax=Nguyenibacter vanlangensis TaxID=1216886 RepID=A0ABZ3DC99_9PROT
MFDWDDAKSDRCFAERGFDFAYAARLFLGDVLERVDDRHDYGETRIQAAGQIDGRPFMVVYTQRDDVTWIISARFMHQKEWNRWQE